MWDNFREVYVHVIAVREEREEKDIMTKCLNFPNLMKTMNSLRSSTHYKHTKYEENHTKAHQSQIA